MSEAGLEMAQILDVAKADFEEFLSNLRADCQRHERGDLVPEVEATASRLSYHMAAWETALDQLLRLSSEASPHTKREKSEITPRMETLLTFAVLDMRMSKEAGSQIDVSVATWSEELASLPDPELQRLVEVVLKRKARNRESLTNLERAMVALQGHLKTRYGVDLD